MLINKQIPSHIIIRVGVGHFGNLGYAIKYSNILNIGAYECGVLAILTWHCPPILTLQSKKEKRKKEIQGEESGVLKVERKGRVDHFQRHGEQFKMLFGLCSSLWSSRLDPYSPFEWVRRRDYRSCHSCWDPQSQPQSCPKQTNLSRCFT